MRIVEVKIEHIQDDMPDTSWMGEYTDKRPDQEDINRGNAFVRQNAGSREYRYFTCKGNDSVEDERDALNRRGMSRGDAEFYARRMMRNNFDLMEALINMQWYFIGVRVTATIEYDSPFGLRTEEIQHAIWGIAAGTKGLSCFDKPLYFDRLIYPIRARQALEQRTDHIEEGEQDVLAMVREEVEEKVKGFNVDVDAAFADVIEAEEVISL